MVTKPRQTGARGHVQHFRLKQQVDKVSPSIYGCSIYGQAPGNRPKYRYHEGSRRRLSFLCGTGRGTSVNSVGECTPPRRPELGLRLRAGILKVAVVLRHTLRLRERHLVRRTRGPSAREALDGK